MLVVPVFSTYPPKVFEYLGEERGPRGVLVVLVWFGIPMIFHGSAHGPAGHGPHGIPRNALGFSQVSTVAPNALHSPTRHHVVFMLALGASYELDPPPKGDGSSLKGGVAAVGKADMRLRPEVGFADFRASEGNRRFPRGRCSKMRCPL